MPLHEKEHRITDYQLVALNRQQRPKHLSGRWSAKVYGGSCASQV
jgi:hypothetical protein